MSMQPGEIPVGTVWVARAAFPKGSLAIRVRDEPGVLFTTDRLRGFVSGTGKACLVTGPVGAGFGVAVRGRADRPAGRGGGAGEDRLQVRPRPGPGRSGVRFLGAVGVQGSAGGANAGRRVLHAILAAAREKGLSAGGSKAWTDSTHVLSETVGLCRREDGCRDAALGVERAGQGRPRLTAPGCRAGLVQALREHRRPPHRNTPGPPPPPVHFARLRPAG